MSHMPGSDCGELGPSSEGLLSRGRVLDICLANLDTDHKLAETPAAWHSPPAPGVPVWVHNL